MPKITAFLWFDTKAEEEALQLRNSECGLRKWPGFPFTNAVSLMMNCESQAEIDHYWEKLAADGGEPSCDIAPRAIA